ncbi:hypothetical protein CFP56_032306 [Quercus suber]|uniref:DUF4283 domain-containing protein n=1 Tax=Quercus suber TaxID=58331 RepID=A0AAW0JJT6_QUESU
MDDVVCDKLDKMKLTTEEEETITITDEGRLEAIESCTLSLVGKFLTCKSFNKGAAKNTIRRAWGLNESMQILEVGPNLFQFKFQSEFDLDRILRGGPWSFDNQLLLLQRWKKGMTVGNIRFESASLWVQIWDAPFDMVSPQVAKEVGSRLGEVEEVEWKKRKDEISQKADSEEAAGNAAEKSPKQGGLGIPMNAAAMAASRGDVGSPREAGNPSSVINSEAVFPGTVAEITHTNKECIYSHANVKEANSVNVGTGKESKEYGQLSKDLIGEEGIVGANSMSTEDDLVDVTIQTQGPRLDMSTLSPDKNGPHFIKPKGSWTRINRMDLGLEGFSKAIMLPGLGKRESREAYEGQTLKKQHQISESKKYTHRSAL